MVKYTPRRLSPENERLLIERWLLKHNLSREHHQPVSSGVKEREEAVNQVETKADTETDFELNATRHYGGYALRKLFHESDRLLIVKYVSPTCSLSKTLTPILNKVVNQYEYKIHLVEIDITEDLEIAKIAQITGTPTIQFFRDKQMLQEMKGVKQKSEFRSVIENLCP